MQIGGIIREDFLGEGVARENINVCLRVNHLKKLGGGIGRRRMYSR